MFILTTKSNNYTTIYIYIYKKIITPISESFDLLAKTLAIIFKDVGGKFH